MTMNTDIQITYRHLPAEITGDFQNLSDKSDLTVSTRHDKEEFSNFTGGPADIEIFIDTHLTELIVGGLILPAVYDALKYSIKTTWKKLAAYYKKKNIEIQEDKNYISLTFNLKLDRTLEYSLEGTLNEQTIDKLNEKIFEYLKNANKQNKDFLNSDFKDKDDTKPKIRMRYNPQTNSWDAVNFAEFEKWRDEQMKRIQDELDN